MAKQRKSSEMQSEIQKLRRQGLSIHKIALVLDIHRKTVRRYLDPDDPRYLPPIEAPPLDETSWENGVGWDTLLEEIRRGVPLKILWQESGLDVGYSGFWKACRKRLPIVPEVAIRLAHVPGERAFFDYCDGLPVVDASSGLSRTTHLFVGVLPFSAYIWAEFVYDQKLPSFLRSQEGFFAAIGGVTPYVVVDNLKSGVTKAHRYDPDVNKTYCDFAGHYGFAVLPARPFEPRDKAAVEAGVGVLQRCFFPRLRHEKNLSLAELNRRLRIFLTELNAQLMKDHGISRNERFEVEKPKLHPLPASRFEISEWREASVHPDCHIQVMKNFYSVPFTFVGKTVRVRISAKLIEVFDQEGQSIASHARIHLEHRYATDDRHYPEAKASYAFFDVHQAKLHAARVGPNTEALVEKLLTGTHPLKYLRRCQGILRLAKHKHLSTASIEYGAKIALATNNLRLDFIQAAATHHEKFGPRPVASPAAKAPVRSQDSVFLHENKQLQEGKSP